MNMTNTILRFDDAWRLALALAEESLAEVPSGCLVLIRDIYGKIRFALDDRGGSGGIPDEGKRKALADRFDRELGAWSPGRSGMFLMGTELFAPEEIFAAEDATWADPAHRRVKTLERNVVGADWIRPPFSPPSNPRVTFYGVKGGVGRSTATAVLAWRLAQKGKRVLVLDLDLESPGVGTTLLPAERAPEFGLVDWFVEDAVGQADRDLLLNLTAASPLGTGGGDLVVAPAAGRLDDPHRSYTFLPKLSRAYADLPGKDGHPETFGDRLCRLVEALETLHRPDVTLLDSRAGLHDIAAVTVTRLGATSLLFATDNAQTWNAYAALFQPWREHYDRVRGFRGDLKMVAAQIPETETLPYLESFQEHAYDLFLNNLYEEVPAGGDEESTFNFSDQDPDSPHHPLRIHWTRSFQQFDPVRRPGSLTEEQIQAGFGDFVRGVSLSIFGEDLG